MFRILAAVGVLLASSTSALALEPSRVTTQAKVSLRGVDFADQASVRQLYVRLNAAANDVCTSADGYGERVRRADRACAEQALTQAVRGIGQPTLTAMIARGDDTLVAASR